MYETRQRVGHTDERLSIVDINDNVLGEGWKIDIHAKRLWHRQVYVQIMSKSKGFLLQKRCAERSFDPLKWTSSASGHVNLGETYLDAAHREIREELGIREQTL